MRMTELFDNIFQKLKDAETAAKAFDIEPFTIYLLGGSAAILGGYSDRATLDVDFVDIGYAANMGRVFSIFNDYDMLEYESAALSPKYKERAHKIEGFDYIDVFVLAREDIIVSKIIRLSEKDIEDIDRLICDSDKALVLKIIDEVLNREDLFQIKREGFIKQLDKFKERYHV